MDQNTIYLLVSACLSAIAILFAIIGVAAPGWDTTHYLSLFKSQGWLDHDLALGGGILLIIAIIFLAVSCLISLLLSQKVIPKLSNILNLIVIFLHVVAAIFIVGGYSRAIVPMKIYCYHLTATSGVLAFISLTIFAYWAGRTSIEW